MYVPSLPGSIRTDHGEPRWTTKILTWRSGDVTNLDEQATFCPRERLRIERHRHHGTGTRQDLPSSYPSLTIHTPFSVIPSAAISHIHPLPTHNMFSRRKCAVVCAYLFMFSRRRYAVTCAYLFMFSRRRYKVACAYLCMFSRRKYAVACAYLFLHVHFATRVP